LTLYRSHVQAARRLCWFRFALIKIPTKLKERLALHFKTLRNDL
jgi:hypothetical protein